jgi:hypothetical protein
LPAEFLLKANRRLGLLDVCCQLLCHHFRGSYRLIEFLLFRIQTLQFFLNGITSPLQAI